MRNLSALIAALALSICAHAAPVDSVNFAETVFSSTNIAPITGMAWAPDGSNRLFLTNKNGPVRIIKNGALLATPFATVSPVYTNSECGVIGICFDPNFVVNHYVYLFVSVSSSQQQIIRYTDVNDIGATKTTIIANLPTLGQNHDGGALGFGYDGKLYWAIGDNGNKVGVDSDLTSLAAKVGRANADGTTPNDNPFIDGAGPNNDFIWARGFRNPFTMTFQPGTGALWLDVVGSTDTGQTNPNSGPGYEQTFVVNRGDHGGYDDWEGNQPTGFLFPVIQYKTTHDVTAQTRKPAAPPDGATRANNVVTFTTTAAHPFRKNEAVVVTSAGFFEGTFVVTSVPSATTFTVNQPGPNATGGGGYVVSLIQGTSGSSAINGGCFYDSTAFPAAYRGNFFYGDYASGRVQRATLDANNKVSSISYFVTGISSYVDICTGPDGALYYTRVDTGNVYRLATTSTAQNLIVTPTAINMAEGGRAVLTVRLAAAPAANVVVNVARTSGDGDVTIFSGNSLTFTPANFATPQIVTVAAAEDADLANDTAVLSVSSPGLPDYSVSVNVIDNDPPNLVVSTAALQLTEGGGGTLTVRLANPSAGNVNVSVARSSGDTDIAVTGGSNLIFTPANYSTPQTVTISAAEDADTTADSAVISIAAPGEITRTVAVTAADNDPAAPAITTTAKTTAVQGAAYTYDIDATGNPAPSYSLTTAPAGMSIDAATGIISWTPGSTGSFNVVAVAANGVAANATQSFSIAVSADAPPAAVISQPANGATVFGTNVEFYGNGNDDVGTTKAEFYLDGVLNYTDVNNDGHYHLNGAHLLWNTTLLTNGPHVLKMVVTDTKGQTGFQQITVFVGNGIGAWKTQYFSPSELGDPTISGDTADPDADGKQNLYEYSRNLAPKTNEPGTLPQAAPMNIGGVDYLTFTFVRARWITDLQYRVEAADDLTNWTPIDPENPENRVGVPLQDVPAPGLETLTIRDVLPMNSLRFMRLKITGP